jgi:WD40 repeat protein
MDDEWNVMDLMVSRDGGWLAVAELSQRGGRLLQYVARTRVVSTDAGLERCRVVFVVPTLIEAGLPLPRPGVAFSPDNGSVAAYWYYMLDRFGGEETRAWIFHAETGSLRCKLKGHDAFHGLAFSSDSRWVAAACSDGPAVFNAVTGDERPRLPFDGGVLAVAFSPDDRWVVAGCEDGSARVFEAETGEPVSVAQVSEDAGVGSVAFSPDGRWVAGLVEPGPGVFSVADGSPRFAQLADVPEGGQVIFSPDLRHIAVNQTVGTVSVPGLAVLDAKAGGPVWQATTSDRVYHIAYSNDGRRIVAGGATASGGGFVHVYDTGVLISERDIGIRLTSIEMSPGAGAPLLGVADSGARVTVLDAASGARLANKPGPGTIVSVAFAEGGSSIAVCGTTGVRLHSILSPRTWTVDDIGPVNAIAAIGPAGDWIATAAGGNVQLFSSATGDPRWLRPNHHPRPVTRLAASSDGRWIATGCADRKTRILDALTGEETFAVEGGDTVETVIFAPNSSLAATINGDGTIIVIDAATATKRDPATRPFPFGASAFSFDQTMIAAACEDDDNTVLIYDVTGSAAPRLVQQIACPAPVSDLAFNPADNTIAILTSPSSLVVRDAHTGVELVRVSQPVDHFAFSADGTLMATTDETIVRVFASGSSPNNR